MGAYNNWMKKMLRVLRLWTSGRGGATAIEYSLIAAGIAMAIAVVVYSLGINVRDMFSSLSGAFGS